MEQRYSNEEISEMLRQVCDTSPEDLIYSIINLQGGFPDDEVAAELDTMLNIVALYHLINEGSSHMSFGQYMMSVLSMATLYMEDQIQKMMGDEFNAIMDALQEETRGENDNIFCQR